MTHRICVQHYSRVGVSLCFCVRLAAGHGRWIALRATKNSLISIFMSFFHTACAQEDGVNSKSPSHTAAKRLPSNTGHISMQLRGRHHRVHQWHPPSHHPFRVLLIRNPPTISKLGTYSGPSSRQILPRTITEIKPRLPTATFCWRHKQGAAAAWGIRCCAVQLRKLDWKVENVQHKTSLSSCWCKRSDFKARCQSDA